MHWTAVVQAVGMPTENPRTTPGPLAPGHAARRFRERGCNPPLIKLKGLPPAAVRATRATGRRQAAFPLPDAILRAC
jgi:hypothetical protein